jgi:hypothetical protein
MLFLICLLELFPYSLFLFILYYNQIFAKGYPF